MTDVGSHRVRLLLTLLVLLVGAHSRLHSSKLSIFTFRRGKGWQFLERMNMQQGNMSVTLGLKL